jgi:hypothetical protein
LGQHDEDGSSESFIFDGRIERSANASATLCLRLAARVLLGIREMDNLENSAKEPNNANSSTANLSSSRLDTIIARLKNNKIVAIVILGAIILSGLAGVTDSIGKLLSFFDWRGSHPKQPTSLLYNGGFEDGFRHWGTGYLETEWYKGSMTPFWASFIGSGRAKREAIVADVRGELVTDVKRSGGSSLKIVNNQEHIPHLYGTISQRMTGLEPNSPYRAELWVKADRARSRALQVTTDLEWVHRTAIAPGTYGWTKVIHDFSTGEAPYIDFRLISEEPGTVWVDDIKVNRILSRGSGE